MKSTEDDFSLQLNIVMWKMNNKRLDALLDTMHWRHNFQSSFAKMNMAERKSPAFKTGKELLTPNRWNNLRQTPACDSEQNCYLANIPLKKVSTATIGDLKFEYEIK